MRTFTSSTALPGVTKHFFTHRIMFCVGVLCFVRFVTAQSGDFDYFGMAPPGKIPEVFAPEIISLDNRNESMITFSPDGKKCYFTVHSTEWNPYCKIFETVFQNSVWSDPEIAPFTYEYSMCPSISYDGTKFFFAAGYDGGMNIFQCSFKESSDWSDPIKMNSEISSTSYEYSCHPSNLGTMFVCSWRPGGAGGCDGWKIPFINGQYQKAENLGALNSIVGDCV